jgi:hypothetical protein
MAQSVSVGQKELERIAFTMYEGETLSVMLCSVGATGYDANTLVASWETVEKSGSGYVRFSEVISAGAWNSSEGAYVLPDIDAEFTSTANYVYDSVVVFIDGQLYPYAVITETPGITLSTGQTQVYRISLRTDD